jgi:hypothetical protein
VVSPSFSVRILTASEYPRAQPTENSKPDQSCYPRLWVPKCLDLMPVMKLLRVLCLLHCAYA